jgi:Zn-dependent metalloprotease
MKAKRRFFPMLAVIAMLFSLLFAPAQAQTPPPPDPQLPSAPGARVPPPGASQGGNAAGVSGPGEANAMDADWQVYHHPGTGKARFLTTRSGNPMRQPASLPAGSSPEAAARSFLAVYGGLFGTSGAADELKLLKESTQAPQDGGEGALRRFLRFQQLYQGIPVLGGELVVQLDAALDVLSVNGELLPDLAVDTAPRLEAESARQKALQAVFLAYKDEFGLAAGDLQTSEPQLWVYNPLLLGAPGLREDRLAWRVEVTTKDLLPLRELLLVDAGRGQVLLQFNQIDSARNRIIYDNANDYTYGLPGNGPVRVEGGAATGVTDADNAYDYAGFTFNFYSSRHGRDSIDGKGMQLISTVRYCPNSSECPYANAFWSGTQMVYGDGYASADDVVGHELTHGVTEHEAGLFYYMQSGAINEALSDIWGEFIDLNYTNGHDNDSSGVRWEMGEDLGAIRDMSNPPLFGDPDRMGSANYSCSTSDSGGVHTNSGVANKAAYLMVDGDTFNGYTITGIGLEKTARIWYAAQTNLLTSAADYQDLGLALSTACSSLVGTAGITSGDCTQVREAVAAVEMHLQPACSAPHAPLCDSEGFDSQFNSAASGWGAWNGNWYVGDTYLYTYGVDDNFASAANSGQFSDIDYEARMERLGNPYSTGVIIRGNPLPLGDLAVWNSGYLFFYTRDGRFSVWRLDNGNPVVLQGWLYTEAILTGDAWNTLRVIAEGPNLRFFINGALVWSGGDGMYSRGQAGVLMYSEAGGGDELRVDYAVLKGGTPQYLLKDNLENPISGRWFSYAPAGGNYWYYPQSNNPFGDHPILNNPEYATGGVYNFWGYAGPDVGDYYMRMTSNVALPAARIAYLHFDHAYDFYSNLGGGVVEYSTNSGGTYNDAGALFTHNGYSGSIANGYSNPLQGRSAFVNDSNGMISSRLNLSTLAGQNVRFRFHIGQAGYEDLGWLIDDVRIYTCQTQVQHVAMPLVMNGARVPASFHSAFSGEAPYWEAHSGAWTATPLFYAVPGLSGNSASASYQQNYSNFTYEVRMRRLGDAYSANRIMVRGTPLPLVGSNYWNSYYSFQYTTVGSFSVFKRVGGASSIVLQDWTASSAILPADSWNVLKVVVSGSALYFYINGTLVWSGTDTSLASGRVGVGMYSDYTTDRLDVDWVSLTMSGTAYQALAPDALLPQAVGGAAVLGGDENGTR